MSASAVDGAPPRILYPLLAFLHLAAPLLFFTDLTRNPYSAQILLLTAGLWAAGLVLAVGVLREGRLSLPRGPWDLPFAVFAAACLLSWALSARDHGPFRAAVLNEGLRVTLFLFLNVGATYLLGALLREPLWRARYRRLLALVGLAAAAYGVLQYMGVDPFWSKDMNPYNGRPVSTFGNPNFLSSFLVVLLPLVLTEGALARSGAGRAAWGVVFLTYAAAIVCTMTRSSWIGAAVSVGLSAWFLRRWLARRKAWAGALLIVLLAMGLFWPGSPINQDRQKPSQRLAELFQGVTGAQPYASWHQRLLIWSCAWDMVRERPVLGKGWGSFELFYPFYQGHYLCDKTFRTFRTHANNAHQLLLEVWSQTGWLGMGAFLWGFAVLWEALRRRSVLLPEEDGARVLAALAGAGGIGADNLFGNVSLFFAAPAFLTFWTLGQAAAAACPERYPLRGRWLRPAAAAAALLCAGGILRAARHWRAEVLYFQGFKAAKRGDFSSAISLTERSRRLRRWEVNNNYELANAELNQGQRALESGLPGEASIWLNRAVASYDQALAANAGYDEIHYNRAIALLRLGREKEAVAGLRAALLINPLAEEAYRTLASIYMSDPARSREALDLLDRAAFYHPHWRITLESARKNLSGK